MVVRLPNTLQGDLSFLSRKGFLVTALVLLFSCFLSQKAQAWTYEVIGGVRVIQNQNITDMVNIDGEAWDGAIIRNNIFHDQTGVALHIRNVYNLLIENNEFYGMQDNAVKLRDVQTRGTDNVIIQNNYFHDMPYTCLKVNEPNTNTKILNNTFYNVTVVSTGDKRHAIYVKGPGYLIEGNIIDGVPDGHGISVRTAGTVRGNFVKNVLDSGIKYYSDASTAGNGIVIVENNITINCGVNGIAFDAGSGPVVSQAIARFNTVVNGGTRGVWIDNGLETVSFEMYLNIIVQSNQNYYDFAVNPDVMSGNLTNPSDIGFENMAGEDFHLQESSSAVDYMTYAPALPPYDYDQNPIQSPYDAGACQYIAAVNPDSDADGLYDVDETNVYNTDPNNPDTDGDALSDGAEVNTYQTNPLVSDTDSDGLNDGLEVNTYGTDPNNPDTDSDGLLDSAEVNTHQTNPLVSDTDLDGLNDGLEVNTYATDPNNSDTDGDALQDGAEVNTYQTNPLVSDTDSDGLNDGEEVNTYGTNPKNADSDSDTLSDGSEVSIYNTNPINSDSDGDNLSDGAEVNTYGTNPNSTDSDGDGLNDYAELMTNQTNPNVSDTDGDGLSDGMEVNSYSTDPNNTDTDSDTLSDGAEVNTYNTNPNSADSDGDGLTDPEEINNYGTNPNSADTDGDGLSDYDELNVYGTNPLNSDTDGDFVNDGTEVNAGTDPNDPADTSMYLFKDDFDDGNRNGWSATGSNGVTWDVVNSALVSTVNGNSGYSYMNSDVVNISQVENMAISYDVTFENGAAWGGILYRGYYLDVNPVRTGWRDNSYKTYAGISSGVKHHVLILIHANSPYYTSDLYVDGKEVFKNEPIEVSSWWNQTIGFVSNYYKGKVTYDNIIIWPNPNPMLLPLDENFNNDEYGLWIGEGNKNINWSFKYGALQSKPNVSGSGYGYFKHALVDVSNKDIIVEYDTAFYKNAKWGGFMYRGVYCDINPSRIGWRDSQYQYTSGFFKNNKQYHVTFIIRQADPYPVSTLYVDDVLIFENEPIEKSSFSDNLIGYVSNYYTGEAYFDNLTVKVFEAGFNLAPAILPIEENTVSLGTTMSFKLEAVDNESDILQYYSDDMLAGSSLDAQTGTFVWTPQYEDIGKHSVHFRVSDGENQSEKELQITVVSPSFTLHYSENFDSGSDVIGEWSESGSGDHIDWKVENRKLCATVIPNTTDGYSYLNSGPIQLPDLNSKKVGIEFDIMPIGNASWGGVRVGGIQCDINPLRIGWRDANYTYSASPIVQMNKQHVIMMINGNKSDIFVDGVHIIKNETIDSPFVNNTLEFVSNYYAGCLNFDNVRVYDLSETTGFQQNPEAFYVSYDFAGSNFNGWTITGNTDNVQFSVLDGKLISQVTGSGGYAYIYPYSLDVSGRSISIEYDVQYDLGASWGGLLYRGIYLDMNPLRIGWRDNNYTPIASTVTANALHHVKVVVRDDQTSDIYVDGQAILMNEPLDVSSFTNNSVGFVSNYYNGQVAISNFSITEDVN